MIKATINDNPDYPVSAETSNGTFHLSIDKLSEYFPSLREYPYEHLNVKTEDDSLVVGVITVASGQGGLIFVWDPFRDELIHASEGAFALTAVIKGDQVVSLHDVQYWGMPEHFELKYNTFGIMDTNIEPKAYPNPIPTFSSRYDGNPDNMDLLLTDGCLFMRLYDETLPIGQ